MQYFTYSKFSDFECCDVSSEVVDDLGVRRVLHHVGECVAAEYTIAVFRLIPHHTH